jgi:hypothetical protein
LLHGKAELLGQVRVGVLGLFRGMISALVIWHLLFFVISFLFDLIIFVRFNRSI